MSTNQTPHKTRELAFALRGQALALFGRDEILSLATSHPEGLATPLYHIDLARGELSRTELPCALRAIVASPAAEPDPAAGAAASKASFYASGRDLGLYRIDSSGVMRLADFDEEVFALALRQDELFALSPSALRLIDPASGATRARLALERATAFDLAPDGRWLALGFEDGRIQAFSREASPQFVAGESIQVHQAPVTRMLFDRSELQVLSAAADNKLMLTQLRGRPETAERSGKGHEGPVLCMIAAAEGAFTGGQDATVRLWAGGSSRRPPSSTACAAPVLALGCWHSGEGARAVTRLAAADSKGRILVLPLDEKRKPQSPSHRIASLADWAERELASPDSRVRAAALDELAAFPDQAAIRRITEQALHDPEARLRAQAARLLAASDHALSEESLRRLLDGPDAEVALDAFEQLLARGRFAPLDTIEAALASEHAALGLAAIARLAGLAAAELDSGAHQALDALSEALEDERAELRQAAFRALTQLFAADPMQAISLALAAAEPDVSVMALRHGYASNLLQSREFLRLVRRHLNDRALEVRYTAFALSLLTRPALAAVLRALDEDLERRLSELEGEAGKPAPGEGAAAPEAAEKGKAAGKAAAKAGAKTASKAKKGPDDELLAAARALSEDQRAPLVEAMATPALDICLAGARALAAIQDPRAFGVLLQLSREQDEATRMAVSKAFSDLGDPNAIPRLRLLLHDPQLNVSDAAFTALGRLLAAAPAQLAEAGLIAPDAKLRLRAIGVIARLLKADAPEGQTLLARALNDLDERVRREAFKTLLNAGLYPSRAETLRFALGSSQSDIRREVLLELEAEKKQPWALALLSELIDDADEGIREQAFVLLRQQDRDGQALYARALSSRYEDVRAYVLALLLTPRTAPRLSPEALGALVAGRLDDAAPALRRQALAGLIARDDLPRLRQALQHAEADVRVGAAAALASYGLPEVLEPLLAVVSSAEPVQAELRKDWAETVKVAIRGLGALGEPAAWPALRERVAESKGKFAKEAAEALRYVVRPEHAEALAALLARPDKALRRPLALALAAIGDPRGSAEVFASRDSSALVAALMLRGSSQELLYGFMDESLPRLRSQALLLVLLLELGERPASPAGCLAGLASAHLDLRLQAAAALERYADPDAFLAAVGERLSQSGQSELLAGLGQPAREAGLPLDQLADLAALLSHGPAPVRQVLAEGLLSSLAEPAATPSARQESLARWWRLSAQRYATELARARAASARAAAALDPVSLLPALLPLAVGTYVGILRQQRAAGPVYRQAALRRLAGIAAAIPAQAEAIATCLKVALFDASAQVREEAFERLRPLVPLSELAAEAIASEQRDITRKALELLTDPTDPAAPVATARTLLSELQQTFDNGLEQEAQALLLRLDGALAAHTAALTARSADLRDQAARALYSLSEQAPAALEALNAALASDYADVRRNAADYLARRKDPRALPLLLGLVASREQPVAARAIESLKALGAPEAAGPLLDLLAARPDLPLARELIHAVAWIGDARAAEQALGLLTSQPKRRQDFTDALLRLSGYDQPLVHEHGRLRVKAEPPRPLQDEQLVRLLGSLRELGDAPLLLRLIPIAALCPAPELDRQLDALSRVKDRDVREAALGAIAWRLREQVPATEASDQAAGGTAAVPAKGAPKGAQKSASQASANASSDASSNAGRRQALADSLRAALGHPDADSKFLAAEGLALAGFADGLQVLLTAIDLLESLRYRQRAVAALGVLAHPRALDPLLRLAAQPEHALQPAAVEALGHLGQSEQAAAIYERLKGLLSSGGPTLRLRALSGLRWFGSPEGWRLIRELTDSPDYELQQHAISLLPHDLDPEAARACLGKLLERESGYTVVILLCQALLRLLGPEHPDLGYLLLASPNQIAVRSVAPDYLARLCREGDAARLIESLRKIHDDTVFEQVAAALLRRAPLPVEAALELLPQPAQAGFSLAEADALPREAPLPVSLGYPPRVADVLLQLLGRVRQPLAASVLEHLAALAWGSWRALHEPSPKRAYKGHASAYARYWPDAAWLRLLLRIVWFAGRTSGLPASFSILLASEAPAALPLRQALLETLLQTTAQDSDSQAASGATSGAASRSQALPAGEAESSAAKAGTKSKPAKAAKSDTKAGGGLAGTTGNTDTGSLDPAWVDLLTRLASQGESELRPLAAALLERVAPSVMELETLLETPQALRGHDIRPRLLERPELLARASAEALRQFGAADVPALARLLQNPPEGLSESQGEALQRVLLETLAQLRDEGAEQALAAFAADARTAKKDSQAYALGRQAARLRSQSERLRRKQETKSPALTREWLEVLA